MRPGCLRPRRLTALASVLVVVLAASLLVGGCDAGHDDDPWAGERSGPLVIASGGATGIYYTYATGLGEVVHARFHVPVRVLKTGGSVENLQDLATGKAEVAFSAVDAAADAVSGRGSFDRPLPVRALARVYDDFVHLVVPADSGIRTIDDLRGRVVSIGAEGSGTALIARRLLRVAGIDESHLQVRDLGIDDSIQSVRTGRIDAFFWSGGLRTPGLTDLSAQVPIRLVPLMDLVDGVRTDYGSAYRHGVVPKGMYGLPGAVPTMAVPNILVVRADMPDSVARALVRTLFDKRAELAARVPAAGNLDRARAIFTEPVDLHPGALRYYRDTKI
jgi:TRAP transporter TAXI family solute receptor